MEHPTKEKGRSYHTATLENKHSHSNKTNRKPQVKLDKSCLLSPPVMLDMLGIRYQRAGAWLKACCPFHKDGKELNPSLSMDANDGHYRCFTCGAKGGDMIAFFRAVTGEGFMQTLKILGADHG